MSLALHLRLRDEAEAAAVARRAIAATLAGTAPLDAQMVSLVVTELIGRLSNATGKQEPSFDVHVELSAVRLRVQVAGPGRTADAPAEPTPAAGWSLLLLERTVDRWGIDDGPATRIWFEIDLPVARGGPGERAGARSTPS